jgi:hypothetical protein
MMPEETSRREFAAAVAALVAAPLLPAAQKADDPLAAQVEALLALAKAKYGKHLDEDQLKGLEKGLRRILLSAQGMNRVKLANADEPAVVFSADVM